MLSAIFNINQGGGFMGILDGILEKLFESTNKNRKLFIVIFIISVIFLILCYGLLPKDQTVKIDNSDYLFSAEAQQYMEISYKSDYPADKYVVIIEEPHYDSEGQYNLYKGLEIFFKDNPSLKDKTIFLSEGVPSNESVSLEPLINPNPNPDEETIDNVLDSFLITGYMAFEWKHQLKIPIKGIENKTIYDKSVAFYLKSGDQDIWAYTVVERNKNMADVLINNAKTYQNPILFVGGLHLSKQDDKDFNYSRNALKTAFNMSFDQNENLGLEDYLKKERIGFTFIKAKSSFWNSKSSDYDRYNMLFKSQQKGDYFDYIDFFSDEIRNQGVTVSPSPEAATNFVAFSKSSGKKMNNNGNFFSSLLSSILNFFKQNGGDGKGPVYKKNGNTQPKGLEGNWQWSSDKNNGRSGRWIDKNKPAGNGASWDANPTGKNGSPGKPHWDVDDGNGNRVRIDDNGNSVSRSQAHPGY